MVVQARQAGHEAAVLSSSRGMNVQSGKGLADALKGEDVIIDVTNPKTIKQEEAN
jgi:hypothetical protein